MNNSQESETLACSECESKFKNTEELQEHVVHEHLCTVLKDDNVSIKSHEELEKWKFEKLKSIYASRRNNGKVKAAASVKCQICGKIFANHQNRRRHEEKIHKINLLKPPKSSKFKCSKCNGTFISSLQFKKHVLIRHPNIVLNEENLVFKSEKEFNLWKVEYSKRTYAQYVKFMGYTNNFGKVQFFCCYRSGSFKSSGKGQRHSKFSGSNKTGYYCPATIKVQYSNTEETVNVRLQTTHMGHSFEIERLSLTKLEKDQLVKDLKSGLPIKRILQDVSKTADPYTRLASTNGQDLRNISKSYGINYSIVKLRNNVLSVDSWVKQLMTSENKSPILIYKPLGVAPDNSQKKDNDFILGFMNDSQEYIFKAYGDDIISIDSTYGPNICGIQLTSIIVKDDNHECFPVAFLWSNQQTEEVFRLFFTSIYKRINQLRNRIFMSDDNPAYYNAWKAVFGESKFFLLCSGQLKKTWAKKALFGPTRIQNLKKRQNVLKYLHCLASEVSELDFQSLSESHIPLLLEDEETHKFGEYFVESYYNRKQQWAACFRLEANININKAIERWHKDLKYFSGLQEKSGGCLIKVIDALMMSLQTKLMNRLVSFDRGILMNKILQMHKNHWLATVKLNVITPSLKDQNVWTVESFTETDKVYEIRSLQAESMHKCNLRCDICNVCLHQYCCSCQESAIKYNFCKHIHLLSLKIKAITDGCENTLDEKGNSTSTVKENVIGKELCLTDSCKSLFDVEEVSVNNSPSTVEISAVRNDMCLTNICESSFDEGDFLVDNSTSAVEKIVIDKELCKNKNNIITKEDARAAVLSCFRIIEMCTLSKQFELIIQTMNRLKHEFEEMADGEK